MEIEVGQRKEISHPVAEMANESEKPPYVEVPEVVLEESGWKLCGRTGINNSFSILVRRGVDPKKALSEGSGVCALHFLRNPRGSVSGGGHIDTLIKGKTLRGEEVMQTGYDPSVGQYGLIVLEKI